MSKFLQEGSQLLIVSDSGKVVWKGNPKNWNVSKVIEIPNTESAIVLLDYYKWEISRGYNLVCIDCHGEILWEASEKNGQLSGELITEIKLENGRYLINTWSGYHLQVDEKDGHMILLSFAK